MNRRSFLTGIGALVGGIALEQAIPFNRVWSFPREIVVVRPRVEIVEIDEYADFIKVSDLVLDACVNALYV